MNRILTRIGSATVALSAVLILLPVFSAFAASAGPRKIVYDAHLLDGNGSAVTSAHSVRFSWWTSADSVSGDTTGTGAINTGASTYANWQEVFTVTPNGDGYFSVELGSGTALPDLSTYTSAELQSLFLQVEVKASGAANTAYELLDTDSSSASIDRSPIDAVPFALNADLLDQRDTGTGSGSIPVLQSGGMLGVAQVPAGTNRNAFAIDADDSASGSIALQFGTSLSKQLIYDEGNSRFDFNDDLRVQGNLTVTGLINGVDIASLSSATDTHLKVASGGGLSVSVAGGSYRINGAVTNYVGSGSVSLSDQSTNYLFFTATGLTVNPGGMPSGGSYIPLASVTATGGAVTGVTDLRVLNSDDRERTVQQVFHPQYANASYEGDGTNNVGRLSVGHDGATKGNEYVWTSTITSLQDFDVLVRVPVPVDFQRWTRNPISVTYRTTASGALSNKLDISVFDTAGTAVTLSGSATGLSGTGWTTTTLDFTGAPVWTPQQDFLIKFTLSAKDDGEIHLGALKLKYVELLGNGG